MVLELREVRGEVGDDVLMVDHTVDVGDLVVDVFGQVDVAHSGSSVVMDLHFHVIKHPS